MEYSFVWKETVVFELLSLIAGSSYYYINNIVQELTNRRHKFRMNKMFYKLSSHNFVILA